MATQTLAQPEIEQRKQLGKYKVICQYSGASFDGYRLRAFFHEVETDMISSSFKGLSSPLGVNSKEKEVYQVKDCAVFIREHGPVFITIHNEDSEKRNEGLKRLEGILA